MSEGKKREKTYKDQEIEARLKSELRRAGITGMGSSAANTRRMGGRARSW